MKRPLLAVMTGLVLGELSAMAAGTAALIPLTASVLVMIALIICLADRRKSRRTGSDPLNNGIMPLEMWIRIRIVCLIEAAALAGILLTLYTIQAKGIEKSLYGSRITDLSLTRMVRQWKEDRSEEIFIRKKGKIEEDSVTSPVNDSIPGQIEGTVLTVKESKSGLVITLKRGADFHMSEMGASRGVSGTGNRDRSFILSGRCVIYGYSKDMAAGDMVTKDMAAGDVITGDRLAKDMAAGEMVTGNVLAKGMVSEKEVVIKAGDRIRCFGDLNPLSEITNPGQYEHKIHLLSTGVRLAFTLQKVRILKRPDFCIRRSAADIRDMLVSGYEGIYPPTEQALMRAMVLGDKSDLPDDERVLYEESGAAHLLSLSGLHVSIIAGRVFRFLRKRKMSYAASCLIGAVFLFFYGLIVSGGSSFLRAALMFCTYLLAEYIGAEYDLVSSMSLAVILMLSDSPWRVRESGCIVSFLSVFAIGLILPLGESDRRGDKGKTGIKGQIPRIKTMLQRLKGRVQGSEDRTQRSEDGTYNWKAIKEEGVRMVGAGILFAMVTGPALMNIYYEWAPWSILLNLVIIPAMVPLMISALFCAFFILSGGLLYQAGLLLEPLTLTAAKAAGIPAVILLRAFHILFCGIRRLPLSPIVTGHIGFLAVVFIYLLEGILFILWRNHQRAAALILFAASSVILLLPNPVLRITMLDVGQGDSILIQCPQGQNMLIDCGSSSKDNLYSYTLSKALKYYGCSHLDYLVVTHADGDHISGVLELLEGDYRVSCLLLPKIKNKEKDENMDMLKKLAAKKRIPCILLKRGDRIESGQVRFACLNPCLGQKITDRNSASVTLHLQYGDFEALFTGDIQEEEEKKILTWLKKAGKAKDADRYQPGYGRGITFLKCAHHGSGGSSCREFLETFRPMIVGISAGRKNRYGHPDPAALKRMKESGAKKVFCTSWGGAIEVKTDGERVWRGYWR